jgi:hypothetical protein
MLAGSRRKMRWDQHIVPVPRLGGQDAHGAGGAADEAAGVVSIDANGGGPGVRLQKTESGW